MLWLCFWQFYKLVSSTQKRNKMDEGLQQFAIVGICSEDDLLDEGFVIFCDLIIFNDLCIYIGLK
jgi:hypothetical protein